MPYLTLIPCGALIVDKGVNLTPGYELGTKVRIPVCAYLIDTDGKKVLVDTGFNPLIVDDPQSAIGEYVNRNTPVVDQDDMIVHRLAQLQLRPEDIDLVVCTHLHFDHAGGNRYFPGRPILVQRSELAEARSGAGYFRHDWDHEGVSYWEVDGDLEIAPGVEVLRTEGHSAGHQSVLVRLPETGVMILAGDAVPHRHHWQDGQAGLATNLEAFKASIQHLKCKAAETSAEVLFSHDPEQWASLRHLPLFYS